MRREVIGELEATGRGKFDEAVTAIAVRGKAAGVQGGVEITVAHDKEHIAGRVGRRRGARHPDAAFTSIRHQIEDAGWRERVRIEGHDPRGVGTNVAMGRPSRVNRSVDLQ